MRPSVFEPRRLRESCERSNSIEGRLARQLRVLSVYAPTPQLRRYLALPRRRRRYLTTVRVAAVATLVLAVSGVATAMAAYVIRRVWPSAAVERVWNQPPLAPLASHPATSLVLRPFPVSADPPREPEVAIAAVTSNASTAFPAHPALLPQPTSQPIAARHVGKLATLPYRPPTEAHPTLAETVEPTTWPALPVPMPTETLPTGTVSPAPNGDVPSQVRADSVTQEAGLLRQALFTLRRDHDAKRTLVLLDDYDRRFGQGALAMEATSTRAQALLQLGDNARALELLDRLPLWQGKHTGELRVIRGELRSLAGRCQDALSDFDDILRATVRTAPSEVARALFGRASCRARIGDLVGAEQDRQRYLKEFPQGPAARQLLSPP